VLRREKDVSPESYVGLGALQYNRKTNIMADAVTLQRHGSAKVSFSLMVDELPNAYLFINTSEICSNPLSGYLRFDI